MPLDVNNMVSLIGDPLVVDKGWLEGCSHWSVHPLSNPVMGA